MHRISTRHLLIEVAAALALLAAVFAVPVKAAPAPFQTGGTATTPLTTQLVDTIYHADGTTATGTVLVSWPAFTTATGQAVPAGNISATIVAGGLVSLSLVPNAGSNPMGSYYTAVYHLDDGSVSREYWVVPVSTTAVTIASIKSTVLPASVAVQTVTKSYVDSAIAAAALGSQSGSQSGSNYVLKAGDTMTGPLILPADPVSASQAADKHYVDTSVASVGGGSGGKVALAPAASQTVVQPTGTALSVNRLNGVEYASQYTTGGQPNGIANATASTDCAAGCEVKADSSYASTEALRPAQWNSETHVEDARLGGRWDSYLNPEGGRNPWARDRPGDRCHLNPQRCRAPPAHRRQQPDLDRPCALERSAYRGLESLSTIYRRHRSLFQERLQRHDRKRHLQHAGPARPCPRPDQLLRCGRLPDRFRVPLLLRRFSRRG